MACDTRLKPRQTITERKVEVRKAVTQLEKLLASKAVTAVVGPQGAIAFQGWGEERDGVSDACAYRQIMVHGSALTKAAIARAEQLAGKSVNRQVVGHGVHSHDGGKTWHKGH